MTVAALADTADESSFSTEIVYFHMEY